ATGNGITKSYGLATVVTLQDDRIRKMADGEIFNTITNGKNTMMAYGPNIMVQDRWAIIAYLRALQRSQSGTVADVPPDHRADLDKPAENKPPEGKPGEQKPEAKPEAPKKRASDCITRRHPKANILRPAASRDYRLFLA